MKKFIRGPGFNGLVNSKWGPTGNWRAV